MILARLTQAIRDQNWTAVGIEFVIVVLGVVIGFQITAWNAAQRDIALERAYLERLAVEFDAIRVELDDHRGDLDDAREAAERFLAAFDAGDAEAMQADAFALVAITRVSEVQIQSAALHELISSGRLGLMGDENLRAALARLPLTEADAHAVFEQFKAQQIDIVDVLRPHLRLTMDGYRVSETALADTFGADTAPELANTLSYAIYINSNASLFIAVLTSNVDEAREMLARELDT